MQARSRVRRADFAVCGGVFAHAHYRFRKRALLVPSRCDLIPAVRSRLDRSVELLYKRCDSVPVG